MSTRTSALDPAILDRWLKEAGGKPVHLKGDLAVQRLRVEELIAEIRRLRGLVERIATVACSEAFRELSQQGYGDIEELCESAVGELGEQRLLGLMHDAVLSKPCPRCKKVNFDCECGEEES